MLRDENGNELRENVRPTQLLHDRDVMYRPNSNPLSSIVSAVASEEAILFPST